MTSHKWEWRHTRGNDITHLGMTSRTWTRDIRQKGFSRKSFATVFVISHIARKTWYPGCGAIILVILFVCLICSIIIYLFLDRVTRGRLETPNKWKSVRERDSMSNEIRWERNREVIPPGPKKNHNKTIESNKSYYEHNNRMG